MRQKEIIQKSTEELEQLLAESREHLRELRFKAANKQLKNVREIRLLKRTIARISHQLTDLAQPKKGSIKKNKRLK